MDKNKISIRLIVIISILLYLLLSESYLARRLVQLPSLLLNYF